MSRTSVYEHAHSKVLAPDGLNRSLRRISHEILERNASCLDGLALVGVLTRGVPLARRISANVRQFEGLELPVGSLDITLHRDDLEKEDPEVRGSSVPFDVTGKTVILVDASKKARQTVLPSSASLTRPSANALARSRISLMSSRPMSSRVRKLLVSNDDHPVLPIGLLQVDKHSLAACGRHVLTDVVGPDRQLPVAAVDENRQPDSGGPTELEERVHRGARGPSRV